MEVEDGRGDEGSTALQPFVNRHHVGKKEMNRISLLNEEDPLELEGFSLEEICGGKNSNNSISKDRSDDEGLTVNPTLARLIRTSRRPTLNRTVIRRKLLKTEGQIVLIHKIGMMVKGQQVLLLM